MQNHYFFIRHEFNISARVLFLKNLVSRTCARQKIKRWIIWNIHSYSNPNKESKTETKICWVTDNICKEALLFKWNFKKWITTTTIKKPYFNWTFWLVFPRFSGGSLVLYGFRIRVDFTKLQWALFKYSITLPICIVNIIEHYRWKNFGKKKWFDYFFCYMSMKSIGGYSGSAEHY